MGKKSDITFGAILVIGVLLAVIGGILFPVVDYIVREEIKKKVVISTTSELYEIWQKIPVPVYMQFYMFDVNNPDEIKAGGKPNVTQRGPYTYRERREKYDIVWNPNGTVTYRQNRTFSFIPEMSVGTDNDTITTLNPIIAVVAQNYHLLPSLLQTLASTALSAFHEELFTTKPIKELLWGYDVEFLKSVSIFLPEFTTANIGYFMGRNYTDDGLYMVGTGQEDINNLGIIQSFNGKKSIDIWNTDLARMVNGSDGTLGPPFLFDVEEVPVFVSDICRSIRGVARGNTETPQGIPLQRYGGDRYDMANVTINPDNLGFCTPETNCLPTGLLNGTLCQPKVDGFYIPVIFSFPHFLYADQDLVESIDGMHPDQKEHDVLVDLEPWTGLVLQASKRLQVNMFIQKVDEVLQTENIRRLYFPIFWLNESSVVDDKHASMLQDQLFTPMLIARIVEIVLLSVGGLMILVGAGLLIKNKCCSTEKKTKYQMERIFVRETSTDTLKSYNSSIESQNVNGSWPA